MNNLIRSIRSKKTNSKQNTYSFEHETCVLCSARLVLKHESTQKIPGQNRIKEVAECPACGIRARSAEHCLN